MAKQYKAVTVPMDSGPSPVQIANDETKDGWRTVSAVPVQFRPLEPRSGTLQCSRVMLLMERNNG